MLSLFSSQTEPVLDEPSVLWIFDLFQWSLEQFDARIFFEASPLVLPTNQHFPANSTDQHEKAQQIFDRVRDFAAVSHWPSQLVHPQSFNPHSPQQLRLTGPVRRLEGEPGAPETAPPLVFSYDPSQLRAPEMMIASFAHVVAHYAGTQAKESPPGGSENWPHAMEVVAVFFGFGLMFANTAFVSRSMSCGSCRSPTNERRNYLSQFDVTYALALFCVLKNIPARYARKYLKKTLHGYFKRAIKDVRGREQLDGLWNVYRPTHEHQRTETGSNSVRRADG